MMIERISNKRNYRILIFSLILLNFFGWVEILENTHGMPKIIKYIISLCVLAALIYYRFKYPSKPVAGNLTYFIILLFILWSLKLLAFELLNFNNSFYIQRVLGQPVFFIPYLLPVIILYSCFDIEFISLYLYYTYLFLIPAIFIVFITIITGISADNWYEETRRIGLFDLGSSLLLLTSQFSGKKRVFNIVLFFNLLLITLYAFYGRRGVVIEYIILFTAMIILRLRSSFLNFNDRMKMYFALMILVTAFIAFGYLVTYTYAFQRGFSKEGFEESRGIILRDFFIDFRSTNDWIFGRGLEGTVLRTINIYSDRGDIVENGFLHVILKGGLLYLIPFVIISLRACYLGIYKSRNDLVKAMAVLILIYVIMMSYYNLPAYSTKYISIWIYITVCFTPAVRNYSNEEFHKAVSSMFSSGKLIIEKSNIDS